MAVHSLRLTLRSDGAPPVEAWAFEVAGTSQERAYENGEPGRFPPVN